MIRIREFADSVGCTPQNIYKHLKTYKAELEGHTEKGRRGLMLDDFACEFIRDAMYPKEISADNELMEELNKLRATVLQLGQENNNLTAALTVAEGERDKALLQVSNYQQLLTTAEESADKLKAEREDLQAKCEDLSRKNSELEAEFQEEKNRPLTFMERLTGRKKTE